MSLRTTFLREVAAAGLPRGPAPGPPVSETDLDPLPEPAKRFLRYMRVPGRSRDWSFRAGFLGDFRRRPQEAWRAVESWQYNTRLGIARLFHMRMTFGGVIPVVGRDTYAHGRGRMLIRMPGGITLGDSSGEEFDVGELVTYLNDLVLIAPSMLLGPEVQWSTVDADSFDLALTDAGRTVRARVAVDAAGAPTNFHTTDRFYAPPGAKPVRMQWSTPIEGWEQVEGRMQFTAARAVWHPGSGEFTYIELRPMPGSRAFNIAPGD